MLQGSIVFALLVAVFILCFKLYQKERNGKLKIILYGWFEDDDGIRVTRTTTVMLVVDIIYRLTKKCSSNKEQCAINISDIVRNMCARRGFIVGKKDEATLREIKGIMEEVAPSFQNKTDSIIKSVNYGISRTTLTIWPSQIFSS